MYILLGEREFVQCIKNIKSSLSKDHFKKTSWQHKYEVVHCCIIIENIFAETNLVKLVNSVRPFCPLNLFDVRMIYLLYVYIVI